MSGNKTSKISIVLEATDKGLSNSLASASKRLRDLTTEVSKLGLMTESAFAKKNMAMLDVKPFTDVRAQMAGLTRAYVDLKNSGKASTDELAKALDNLRAKNRELYASISAPSKLTSARSLLGVKSSAEIAMETRRLEAAYLAIKNSGTASMREIAQAQEALRKKTRELTGETQQMKTTFLGGFGGKVGAAMLGAFAVNQVAGYADQVRRIADEYVNLNSRLKTVTSGEQELSMVRERLYQISQETGTEFASNADAYAKLGRAVKDMGGDAEDTLQIVEMVNKTLTINGSSAAMSSAFILQFAQAMGSGVLQGDEFRSMLENNGYFASVLAKALETDITGLRKMSKAGELTADVLRGTFPKMAEEINATFGNISPTIGRALTMLDNAFKRLVNDSNEASGGTGKIAASIIHLAQTIENNRESIIDLFSFIANMAAGATDKVMKLVGAVGNIIQSGAGWEAVFNGDLSFFEFATMDAKELHAWLEKNKQQFDETGKAGERAHKQVADGAKQAGAEMKKVTGDALKEMEKKYKEYTNEVKRLQSDLADDQRSAEEELREMKRSGMSDLAAWRDRKKEAGEFTQKAREAAEAAKKLFAAGNIEAGRETYKVAAEYADKAKSAYKDLNEEVKSGDRVLIGQGSALRVAMAGVREAGAVKADILRQQADALQSAKDALNAQSGGQLDQSVTQAKANIQDLAKVIEEAGGNWGKVWEHMQKSGEQASGDLAGKQKEHVIAVEKEWVKAAPRIKGLWIQEFDELGRKIDEVTKPRTVTVYTNVVEGSVKKATGGLIRSMATGGKLPGYGGGDRISALLEAGEFVVRKEAVSKFGAGLFHALNSLRLPEIPRFAAGGMVGGSGSPININLSLAGATYPMQTSPMTAEQLQRDLARAHRLRSR